MLIIWWSNRKFPLFFFFFEFVIYFHPSAGAYVEKGRWLTPLGEALCENPALQLVIPMRARRAPPLPPSPSPDLCALLLDMLAFDPDARPTALQLQERVYRATDTHWSQKILFVYLDPIRPPPLSAHSENFMLNITACLVGCVFSVFTRVPAFTCRHFTNILK